MNEYVIAGVVAFVLAGALRVYGFMRFHARDDLTTEDRYKQIAFGVALVAVAALVLALIAD